MTNLKNKFSVFGLSHLGQVFSLCWSKKLVIDMFDNDKSIKFIQRKKYTLEEPNLKLNLNRVKFLEKFEDIKNVNIFFLHTYTIKY